MSTLESWAQRLMRRSGPPSAPVGLAGLRLVGAPETLSRVLAVRPGTVVVLLEPGLAPQVRRPGEAVAPPVLAPSRRPVVLPFCTLPVALTATVQGSVTFDGQALEPVTVGFSVELDPGDDYAGLLSLVTRHGAGVEAALLAAVHQEVAHAVVSAVRVNRLADLRRLSLTEVLRGWWPAALAGGLLRSVHLDAVQTSWPEGVGEAGLPELDTADQPRPRRAQLTSGPGAGGTVGAGAGSGRRVGGHPASGGSPGASSSSGGAVGVRPSPAGAAVVTSFGTGTAADAWSSTGGTGDPVPAGAVPAGAVPARTPPAGTVAGPAARGTVAAGTTVSSGPGRPGETRGGAAGSGEELYEDGEPTVPLPRVVP